MLPYFIFHDTSFNHLVTFQWASKHHQPAVVQILYQEILIAISFFFFFINAWFIIKDSF